MTYLAISAEEHADASYQPVTNFEHAQQIPACPAFLPELAELSAGYVLCFMQHEDHFKLVALLGTVQTGCAYTRADHSWAAPYVPADLRARPFALLKAPDKDVRVLCIDEHALSQEPDSLPLFDEPGRLSESVQKQMDFLAQAQSASQSTDIAVKQLTEAGVIKEWQVTLEAGEQKGLTKGLYSIDQEALNALPAETYHALRGAPMIIAYAQVFSMRNLVQLNARLTAKTKSKTQDFDFDSFLEESESDTLQF